MRRTSVAALCLLLAALAGCSSGSKPSVRPAQPLTATGAYEQALVADGAAALWSFRDATHLSAQDEVADLTASKSAAVVVGGTVAATTGPQGEVAAQFLRSGRVVTPIASGLSGSNAFTVELDLRNDRCVNAWGRVLGTSSDPASGREGFELLHYPQQFGTSACRFAVEFWHLNAYLGGCQPPQRPLVGVWDHWTVVYATGRVTCYLNGVRFKHETLNAPRTFSQLGPLGIGGSGSGFQGPLDGASVAEVAVYRRALTPAEVMQHAALARTAIGPRPTTATSPHASPTP